MYVVWCGVAIVVDIVSPRLTPETGTKRIDVRAGKKVILVTCSAVPGVWVYMAWNALPRRFDVLLTHTCEYVLGVRGVVSALLLTYSVIILAPRQASWAYMSNLIA